MRRVSPAALLAAVCLLYPTTLEAQEGGDIVIAAGGGVTWYCIVSRCDDGTAAVGLVGYALRPSLLATASGRWHDCFDCDRFLIAEIGLQLRDPAGAWRPFVGGGIGLASDPEFFGDRFGVHAGVGTWLWLSPSWGLVGEVRGRTVGSGDGMADVTLGLAWRR